MSEANRTMPPPLPLGLESWIALNVKFCVLLCVGNGCRRAAQSPTAMSRHLRDKHKVNLQVRKQVNEYIREFLLGQHDYDFQTVRLPPNGLLPQPILQIIDGF